MANINVSVTQSIEIQPNNLIADTSITYSIDNPLKSSSYFVLETTRNAEGFYDNTSPKNLEGTITTTNGISDVVKDDYKAGVIVLPGGGDIIFTPTNDVISTTLLLRGMGI